MPLRHPTTRPTHRLCVRPGFTLAEVLLASAILAFSVAALSQALVAGQVHAHEGIRDARATSLLEATMAEIARLPYADPEDGPTFAAGPDAGETTRLTFDNLDDWHGWSEASGSLTDFAGNAYPDSYAGYARSVEVTAAAGFATLYTAPYSGIRVLITVTHDTGRSWTLERHFAEPSS